MTLYATRQSNTGTVSGIITDSSTLLPIGSATVGLYEVAGTTETLIQLTKTNGAGRYLFGSVEAADYIVKAFAQKQNKYGDQSYFISSARRMNFTLRRGRKLP
jgi:hypothetical protein